ncbi:MAG: nitroreductase family protein [Puniceicoccales bacterium]|jgi:nitroreductase|nr:nitroreductase family protein [Puniceicoccales bacterium]
METNPVVECILSRRSVRKYKKNPLPADTLAAVLRCGIYAPTAWHREPWAIRVLQDSAALDRFNGSLLQWMREIRHPALGHFQEPNASVLYHAPVLVVIAGDMGRSPMAPADCFLAAENILLAAWSFSIGSCIIASAVEFLKSAGGGAWRSALQIPAGHEPVVAAVLGYAADGWEGAMALRDDSRIGHVHGAAGELP